MGEETPSQYFVGDEDLRAYTNPNFAARSRLILDDVLTKRDEQETQMAENFTRRLGAREKSKILPFSTAAEIANHRSRTAQAESDLRNNPFMEAQQRETAQTTADEQAAERRLLPLKEQTTQAELEREASGAPQAIKDGVHPLAYDLFLREVMKEKGADGLPDKEIQRQAKNRALRLANDAPYVEAVEQEALELGDDTLRSKFIEDFRDEETGARFSRLKPDADPAEVSKYLRKHTYSRQKAAEEKAQWYREKEYANTGINVLREEREDIDNAITKRRFEGDPAGLAAAEARRKEIMDEIASLRKTLLDTPKSSASKPAPEEVKVETAKPAATPAAPAPTQPIRKLW